MTTRYALENMTRERDWRGPGEYWRRSEMQEYVVYDQDFLDIPFQDYPSVGVLMVCHDPQNRLRDSETSVTWAVVESMGTENPPKAWGLFWDRRTAELFAGSYSER